MAAYRTELAKVQYSSTPVRAIWAMLVKLLNLSSPSKCKTKKWAAVLKISRHEHP